jgi:hypothetical protein
MNLVACFLRRIARGKPTSCMENRSDMGSRDITNLAEVVASIHHMCVQAVL